VRHRILVGVELGQQVGAVGAKNSGTSCDLLILVE
jgi:hypothetical protein